MTSLYYASAATAVVFDFGNLSLNKAATAASSLSPASVNMRAMSAAAISMTARRPEIPGTPAQPGYSAAHGPETALVSDVQERVRRVVAGVALRASRLRAGEFRAGSRPKMYLKCGDSPLDLCLRAERAAMTELSVSDGKLNVVVKGWDKVWSLRSHLEIPIEDIIRVYSDPEIAKHWWKGVRMLGTHVPGVIAAGTFYHHGDWIFWDVHHPEKAVVIDLRHEHYAKLIVEVENPSETVAAIQAGLPTG